MRAPALRRAAVLSLAGAAVALTTWMWSRSLAPADPRQALQQLVSDAVAADPSIRNCVVSVAAGDGSFEWTGAAGAAHVQGPVAMTPDTPIYVASVTKLYVAAVIMALSERHALSLEDPMAKYLPPDLIRGIHVYRGRDHSGEITIRQLLSHRSGIGDYYDDPGPDGKSLFERFVAEPHRGWTVDETIDRARQLPAKFEPGTQTSYSDTNFQLLGKVIEAVTRRPLDAVLDEVLFTPLDLEHTWLVGHPRSPAQSAAQPADVFAGERDITPSRANGAYWADGGIVSTAREMNLFLRALADGRVVGRESLRQMQQWHHWRTPLDYGLGMMRFDLPQPLARAVGMPTLWGHSGSTGSFVYRSDALNLFIAGTVDQTDSRARPFVLMRKVVRVVESLPRDRSDASRSP